MVIPPETERVARAVFPGGCLVMRMRDLLGPVFTDEEFAPLFSSRGQPAVSPGRLALVSVLQFAEGLTDRQAAHAVRARIDWKYALGLGLDEQGFDFSVLSEFRSRLIDGGMQQRILEAVLDAARAAGLVKAGGRQRTDATHVLAAVRELRHLEFVHETLRAALNQVAAVAADWLIDKVPDEWFGRYSKRSEDSKFPSRWAARSAHADQVGTDGITLLKAVWAPDAPPLLRQLPAMEVLRRTWIQQYITTTGDDRAEVTSLRRKADRPPASLRIISPYDTQARTGVKRDEAWNGYKIHLTETCENNAPHMITNVATTTAQVSDMRMTGLIHDSLAARNLRPDEHLVDSGYIDAGHITDAMRDHRITLIGPLQGATTWQSTGEASLASSAFTIDWDTQTATCPAGKTNVQWRPTTSHRGTPVTRIRFAKRDCDPCVLRSRCTNSTTGRNLTLRPRNEHETLARARSEQLTTEWRRRYQHRSGVEGTIAQAIDRLGARRSRYRGTSKTALQHQLTAAAMNLIRLDAWITGQPFAPTRVSHFAALRPTGI
jgi:transposase